MDVLDILHDSGLGTGTHSLISQGSLDSILQSKPEDRRALIEEAAGVLKHKQRKAKSERKLEQMDQHLARARDVVEAVVRLAAKLGLDTVAEGIEDERQLAFLQSVGCGLVQDYVFAEPLPFDEFERWADTRARAVASGAGSASRSVPGMPAASRNVRTAASMSR